MPSQGLGNYGAHFYTFLVDNRKYYFYIMKDTEELIPDIYVLWCAADRLPWTQSVKSFKPEGLKQYSYG